MDFHDQTRLQRKRSQKRTKGHTLLASISTFILLIGLLFFTRSFHQSSSFVTEADTLSPSPIMTTRAQTNNSAALGVVVQNALEGTTGSYGIVVKNLSSKEIYSMNEHKAYKTGSLYKLWVMAVVYNKIQAGELKKDQVLSEDVKNLNDMFQIASESAELTDRKITLSVSDALFKMITISDNYSALLLSKNVWLSSLVDFLKANGFTESKVGIQGEYPTSTPYDIALFFEKLYYGELAKSQYTQEMITLLKNQRLNDKLPKYLPDEIVMAHKTGELWSVTHDAGIAFTPAGNYIIAVLSDSNNPSLAEERISEVSKNVYTYFNP